MGLTSPQTLNDGTSDHVYSFTRQEFADSKSIVGFWGVDASDEDVNEHMTVKHQTAKTGRKRHAVQLVANENVGTAEEEDWQRNEVTIVVAHHPRATTAELDVLVQQAKALLGVTDFTKDLKNGKIGA